MSERYAVHHIFNGHDEVVGHFEVRGHEIHFDDIADEHNCDLFPPGPIAPVTAHRLTERLNNRNKTIYITRA